MNLIQSTEVRGQVTPLFTHIQLNFESNCQMVTNARLKMEKKIVWLQIKIKVRLFRSNAFPVHRVTNALCTIALCTGPHFTSCYAIYWSALTSAFQQRVNNAFCTTELCKSPLWTSLHFTSSYAIYWSDLHWSVHCSRESPMHFALPTTALCLLSGLRSGLHLLFMQSTDLHWPVKSHHCTTIALCKPELLLLFLHCSSTWFI